MAISRVPCPYCNKDYAKTVIKRHQDACIKNPDVLLKKQKTCPVCCNIFYTTATTCSTGCANTYFRSGINNPNHKKDSATAHITICFSFHKKECIICQESNIVEVHHFDEDHTNNSPSNLIPLCPTHHQYFHSKYRHLVESQINNYRDYFIKNIPPFEDNS